MIQRRNLIPPIRVLAAVAMLAACATPPPEAIPAELPFDEALRSHTVHVLAEPGRPGGGHVVVVKDRHSTRPGFHRVRPQLRDVQRDNRLLVEYLVGHGFALLGCEYPLGPLVETPANARHYDTIRRRLKYDSVLDEYGVFQPIYFQIVWGPRLEIHGVEDPALFEQDKDDLEAYLRATRHAARRDLTPEQRESSLRAAAQAVQRLRRNVDERGAAAARHLVDLMREREAPNAILLLGGSHVPAAARVLHEAGVRLDVVQSLSYDDASATDG